jgi:hypothetical protein
MSDRGRERADGVTRGSIEVVTSEAVREVHTSRVETKDWHTAEWIDPQTIDEARFKLCAELHRALYGDVWARPESPAEVWAEMLDRIERAARALRR